VNPASSAFVLAAGIVGGVPTMIGFLYHLVDALNNEAKVTATSEYIPAVW